MRRFALLLAMACSAEAIALVQDVAKTSSLCSDSTHCSVTVAGTGAGNLGVVCASFNSGSGSFATITDNGTGSSNWQFPSSLRNTTYRIGMCAYSLALSSGATTISWTQSAGNFSGIAWFGEFSTTNGPWAFTATPVSGGSASTFSTAWTNGNLTLSAFSNVVIQAISTDVAISNVGGGYSRNLFAAWLMSTSSGTSPTWTTSNGHAGLLSFAFNDQTVASGGIRHRVNQ